MKDRKMLTVSEVAEYTNLCQNTVYGMISRGELIHTRVGGSIRIRATDLERWLSENTVNGRTANHASVHESLPVNTTTEKEVGK